MHAYSIFWPMLAVMLIPIVVLLLNAKRKADDRKAGNLNADQPINNKAWSLPVVLTSNSLENQFQFPVIFYALCLITFQIDAVTTFAVVLASLYAASRWVHAVVHVSSNFIPARLGSFLLSTVLLIAYFGYVVGALMKRMETAAVV